MSTAKGLAILKSEKRILDQPEVLPYSTRQNEFAGAESSAGLASKAVAPVPSILAPELYSKVLKLLNNSSLNYKLEVMNEAVLELKAHP